MENYREGARKLARFRLVMGAGFFLAPRLNAWLWTGGTRDPRLSNKLMRALGARDLVVGMGLRRALKGSDAELSRWLMTSALFDLGDGAATFLSIGRVPLKRWLIQLSILGGAAASGLVLSLRARMAART